MSDEEDDEAKEERRKQLAVLEKEKVCIYTCVCALTCVCVCVCSHSLSCTVDYIYTLSTYCVGNALFKEGKLEAAVERYSRAMDLDPKCRAASK